VRTALLAIIGFMPTHGNGAVGSLDYTPEERKLLARKWDLPSFFTVFVVYARLTVCRQKHGEDIGTDLCKNVTFGIMVNGLIFIVLSNDNSIVFSIIAKFLCFSVNTVTRELLYVAWWNFAWTCISTTSRTMGQRSRSQDRIFICFTIVR